MTYINAWMSSKFDRIGSQTAEFNALERLEKKHRHNLVKKTSSHFLCYFYPILIILAGNADIH